MLIMVKKNLKQLVKANSQNQECHYGQILGDLKCKALCNVSNCTESILDSVDSLQASLITQLQAIGIQVAKFRYIDNMTIIFVCSFLKLYLH